MRVRSYNRVGVGLTVTHHDHAGQVFNVDLVDDAGARWHDLEFVECSLTPTQELVALLVALVLQGNVETESFRGSKVVRDHGVVNDQFRWSQRVDLGLIATQITHCLAHRRQVYHAGNTGKVLHDHAGRTELNFSVGLRGRVPRCQRTDVVGGDICAIFGAQHVF